MANPFVGPSGVWMRLCTRLRKIRCLLKEYWGLFQGHLYLTSSDKVVFEKSMSVLSILLEYELKRRERRKSVVLKNHCKIFRDNNHQSSYKKFNSIMTLNAGNSGPVYVNELPLS